MGRGSIGGCSEGLVIRTFWHIRLVVSNTADVEDSTCILSKVGISDNTSTAAVQLKVSLDLVYITVIWGEGRL